MTTDVPKDYYDNPTEKCAYCKEEHLTQFMLTHPELPELFFCSGTCMERYDREHFSPRGWL